MSERGSLAVRQGHIERGCGDGIERAVHSIGGEFCQGIILEVVGVVRQDDGPQSR